MEFVAISDNLTWSKHRKSLPRNLLVGGKIAECVSLTAIEFE